MLTEVENYGQVCGLKINTSETKAMDIDKRRHTSYKFNICNSQIETVTSFKYLGMICFENG